MKNVEAIVDHMSQNCLAVRLRMLSRVVNGVYAEALRHLGVTGGQLNLPVVIGRQGEARASDIAELLKMDQSTISRNLKLIQQHCLIEAIADPADSRVQWLRLTRAGREGIRAAYPAWKKAQKEAAELLGPELADKLLEVVRSF